MPVPPKGGVVLVTGANGYIASWIGLYLLQNGFKVRGTTRNASKGEWMRQMFVSRGHQGFEYIVVSDLQNPGAFEQAVIGVDAIIHCASPFHWNVSEPDDFIKPAVTGTQSVLEAAAKAPKVQRLIITSSFAAQVENREPGTATFVETDWNQQSIDAVNKEGSNAWRMHWYRASKTLAERTAWEFVEQTKPHFDLATVCPPYVLGPPIHEVAAPEALNTSAANWYSYLKGDKTTQDAIAPAGILCDVRDVAQMHIEALVHPEAAGHRFGIATRTFTIQVLLDHIHDDLGDRLLETFPNAVRGIPGEEVPPINWFDCSRSLKMLGMTPRSDRETAIDMTENFIERQKAWDSLKQTA